MRIAIAQRVTMAHGVRGGMEVQSHILAEGLQQRGHDVVILTTPHPDGRAEGVEGTLPVRYISPGTHRRYDTRWWDACSTTLAHLHEHQPFDVLLSQSAGALGYLAHTAADLRIPAVVVIHGSIQGELRTRWRTCGSPRGFYRLVRHVARQPSLFVRWRKVAPMVRRWVVVSHETAREWQQEQAIPPERLTVIPNGIDTRRFVPDAEARRVVRARLGIADTAPVLVAVGRLEKEKGFHKAIQAVQKLCASVPDVRLLIAGDGVYRATLERMAARTHGAVSLLGHVPNEELPALLAASDVFVMATIRDEGFPMTIPEAMACGLPVVASRVGGIPSAVADGTTGFLVPMGDVAALTQAIARLLTDTSLLHAMSAAAHNMAVTRLSRDHMVAATEQVLSEVVEEERGVARPA